MALQNSIAVAFFKAFESFTGALKTIDNDHAYIHNGIMFGAYDKTTVATTDTVEYAFITPSTGYIHYRLAGITTSADSVDTAIYEDAEVTAETGTELVANNRSRSSSNTATAAVIKNPTFTDGGTLLPAFSSFLPGSTGIGQTRVGAGGKSEDEIVFKQNTVYRFVATNGSSGDNIIASNLRWYEEQEG